MAFQREPGDFVAEYASQERALLTGFRKHGGRAWILQTEFLEGLSARFFSELGARVGAMSAASAWKEAVSAIRLQGGFEAGPTAAHVAKWVLGQKEEPTSHGRRHVKHVSNLASPIAGYLHCLAVKTLIFCYDREAQAVLGDARDEVIAYHAQSICARAKLSPSASVPAAFHLVGEPCQARPLELVVNMPVGQLARGDAELAFVAACASYLHEEVRLLGEQGMGCSGGKPFLPRNIQTKSQAGAKGLRARVLAMSGHKEEQVTSKNSECLFVRLVERMCDTSRGRRNLLDAVRHNYRR
jgi:hypothetical protein